ncbi:MAG: DUF4835 family protein [Bacteroidetes bacterium]|nr:DUF4835 family protein [Bacteroidota bacterium]
MIRRIIFVFVFTSALYPLASSISAQELNCTVQVVAPALQASADKQILQTLQQTIYEFMNQKKWTNDVFAQDERIECSIVITVTSRPSSEQFVASLQVQSRRPIFKTSYNSLLFNYIDQNCFFNYTPSQPFEYNDNTYTSNLTSILSFYAYYIIGLDYDSYSLEGGTFYFQKAQQVVTNAQVSPEKGWQSSQDTRNRYWLSENILNNTFKPLRECIYKYHRLGFDVMAEDLNSGRTAVMQSMDLAKQVFDNKPNAFNLQMFFLAKADELVNLFSQLEPTDKQKMVDLLNQIDPGNTTKYNKTSQSSPQ